MTDAMKMSQACPDDATYRRLLKADGDMASAESRLLEAHLSQCSKCRLRLESLAVTPSAVDLLGDYSSWNIMAGPLDDLVEELSSAEFLELVSGTRRMSRQDLVDLLDADERSDVLGRLGDLEVMEVLGQGGMGAVLRARDPALDREVAVKLLKPDLAEFPDLVLLFREEARSVAALTHEHILPIHQVADHHGLPYFVMPLVTGATLAGRLRVEGAPPFSEALAIAVRISRALESAHNAGVVHGDLKPGNILFGGPAANSNETTPATAAAMWLADFGLGKRRDTSPGNGEKRSERILSGGGTPGFVAPEIVAGGRASVRGDIYGLGKIFEALIAGDKSVTPHWFQRLVGSMTDDDVRRRPESVGAVVRELERGRDEFAACSWRNRMWSRCRRLAALLAVLLLSFTAMGFACDAAFSTAFVNGSLRLATGRDFRIEGRHGVYRHLADAVAKAENGDVVVVVGDDEHVTPPLIVRKKNITIRAAKNARPVIRSQPLIADWLLWAQDVSLRIEGIDFVKEMKPEASRREHQSVLKVSGGSLEIVDCRIERSELPDLPTESLVLAGHETQRVVLRNCELRASGAAAVRWGHFGRTESSELRMENCRFSGRTWLYLGTRVGNAKFARLYDIASLNIHASDCRVRCLAGIVMPPTIVGKLALSIQTERCHVETENTVIAMPGGMGRMQEAVSLKDNGSFFFNFSSHIVAFADPYESSYYRKPISPDEASRGWRRFWLHEDGDTSTPRWIGRMFKGADGWDLREQALAGQTQERQ